MNDSQSSILLGTSSKAGELAAQVARAAATDVALLIQGESGTGKGVVAESVHKASSRASGPFVTCDLGAVAADGVEAALRDAMARAQGGSLSIELPKSSSDALRAAVASALAALVAAGSETATARVMVSTVDVSSPDLEKHCAQRIDVPALRARRDDIPALAEHIVKDFARAQGRAMPPVLTPETMTALGEYEWPGNVRELAGVLQRAMSRDPKAEILGRDLVRIGTSSGDSGVRMMAPEWQTFKEAKDALLEEWEKDYLRRVLERSRGNMTLAARQAGIARGHLYRLMKKHGLAR
jgi:DNA-binding NtrC family response regulator